MFRIYPAVDIKDGRCVRLYQGDPERETVFSDRPWEVALDWEEKGASFLHVVDLDGAAGDALVNLEAVTALVEKVSIPVQVGGGVRSREDVEMLLSLGVERVILGTRALTDYDFAAEMIADFKSHVIVSIDSRGEEVAVSGWRDAAPLPLDEILQQLIRCGAERVIHTDITRDGTLRGYDTRAVKPFLNRGLGIIAAGGISSLEDLSTLKSQVAGGVEGAIVGKAIYSGDLTLGEILPMEEA